ncbi:MAG: hypothetical protein MJ053_02715 [Elusimicrobiaceae bacterium]|nr:hypothetical protein [Elusimicrobiaceae bacterium]
MTKKTVQQTRLRRKHLFQAFKDINRGFTDWYKATQLEIDTWEQETASLLLKGNL